LDKKVSLIIPCYNEGPSLSSLYKELKKVLEEVNTKYHYSSELIFINDGSKDDTLNFLKKFAKKDINVKYISFSRNFGKEAAMKAGLEASTGDCIVIIDADLQHPPDLILDMIRQYEQGYHQVIAKRSRTGEKFFRKILTKTYYKIVNNLIDVKLVDGIGDFRLLSRQALNSLMQMPEYNRFSKGLFSWIGYKEKIIEYENKERELGESKWRLSSLLNYAIDGIVSFNSKPLRLIIYLGLLITILNIGYISYNYIKILLFGVDTPGYFTLISAILLLGGIQLISIGILGEYIGRIFYEVKLRPSYIIEESNIEITE